MRIDIFAEERLKSFSPLRGRINTVHIDDLTTAQAEEFVSAGMRHATPILMPCLNF